MTGSERPSPEPLLKKEASPAVLGGREAWKCSEAFKCLNYRAWGIPAVLSRGIPGRAFPGLPGIFLEFPPESPSRTGVWPKSGKNRLPSAQIFLPDRETMFDNQQGGHTSVRSRFVHGMVRAVPVCCSDSSSGEGFVLLHFSAL